MQETTEAPVQVSAEQPTQTQQEFNPFASNSWSETIPQNPTSETKPTEGVAQPSSTEPTATPSSQEPAKVEPTPTVNEWWKTFGWENEDAAKAEIPKLKEHKPAEEIKWANEDSKKVHELLREGKIDDVVDIYNKQKQLDKVLKSEVNTQTADEIIKLQMKLKYPTLNDQQIDFQFNEDYGVGKKPVQKETELEEDFNERLAEYNERAERVNMKKTIAATMAIPELQKLKTEIKFPEISQPQIQPQPSQESLEAARVARENFLQKLESDYTKVEGFQTKVKDESVELAIGHKIPDEVKVAIKGRLTEGMDVNEFMDNRWFDAKGNANINQIILDIYQLENLDKILSSVANNAANQRMAEYIKASKNLNINNGNGFQQTFQPSQQAQQNVSPYDSNAWSEKPPLIQN